MNREISSPLLRTRRLLDLVPYINTHQGIELKELARHFDVTASQMHADLMTLWMCGLPGYTPLELMNLDFESGYVSISNAPTLSKPRTITFQEGVALLLGLDLLASSLPENRGDLLMAVDSLRQRLTKLLGVPVKLSVVPAVSGSIPTTIAQAVHTNGGLQIRYHSMYKDQTSDRLVVPVDVYESKGHQYRRAFGYTANDYREFRMDRIQSATTASVPAQFESKNLHSEKIGFTITGKKISREVAERFALSNYHLGKTIELTSYSRQWIERSVMASGGALVLNSPLDIRAEVAEKAQLMLNRYKEA